MPKDLEEIFKSDVVPVIKDFINWHNNEYGPDGKVRGADIHYYRDHFLNKKR